MKKVFIPTFIILMAALYFGCAKKKTNVEFDVVYSTDLAVPSMTAGMTYTVNSPDILTGIADQLAKNGTNADRVGEAKCTTFNIAVKTPTTGGLSYIKWIKFYINAINQPELQTSFLYNEKKRNSSGQVTQDDSLTTSTTNKDLYINDSNLKNRYMENSVYFKYKIEPLYTTSARTITATHTIHIKAITE